MAMTIPTQTNSLAEIKPWSLLRLTIVLIVVLASTSILFLANLFLGMSNGPAVPFMSAPRQPAILAMVVIGAILYGLPTLVFSLTVSFSVRGLKAAALGALFAGLATVTLLMLDFKEWGSFSRVIYEIVALSGIALIVLVATGRLRRPMEALPLLLVFLGVSWVTLTIGRSIWRQEINFTGWYVTIQWCVGAWIWMSAVYWTEVAARRATWVGGIIWLALMLVPLIFDQLGFHLPIW